MGFPPERTCVGCRERAPKGRLLRVVRTDEGVRADPSATLPGRGAYLHRDAACAGRALERGALARALRASISEDEVSNLLREVDREA